MNETLKKFDEYMADLNLSEKTVAFWKERFYPLDKKGQEEILVLFDDFPNDIEFFTELQMRKEQALKDQDKQVFEQIALEEATFIAEAYKNK